MRSITTSNSSLDDTIAQLNKKFGLNTVLRMGDAPVEKIEVISTGSIALDKALGVGGFPRGRIVEIYGQESSGKTTVALQAIACAQVAGGTAAFIDVEHALDPTYARALGVDLDRMLLCQPDSAEQALEVTDQLIRSGGIAIIVIDSVAALVPRAELDGEMGDAHMGLQARLMGQALRKITGSVSSTNTLCIFINQLREKIGIIFGSPVTTSGGKALKFYASVRLDVRRTSTIKDGEVSTANRTMVKVVKNKCSPPFTVAEFDIVFGEGVSKNGELVDLGVAHGIVKKSGAWYSYNEALIGQGKEKARDYLRDNSAVADEIELKVRAALGI